MTYSDLPEGFSVQFSDIPEGFSIQKPKDTMSVLPEWAQTLHSYIDPGRVFAGKAGQREDLRPVESLSMLSMALPAGTGHPIPTGAPLRPNLAPKADIGQAALNLGVEIPNAAVGGVVKRNLAAKLSDTPFAGTPLETQSQKAIGQLGEAATKVEQGYGGVSPAQAGADARDSITNYMRGTTKAEQERLYNSVDAYVPPTVTGPLNATRNLVNNLTAQRANSALPPSPVNKIVEEALTRPGMNYQGIKGLRTNVGEMLDTGVLPAGVSNGELKQLYSALTEDMKAVVARGGPNASAAFDRANAYSAAVSNERRNLYRIVGAKSDEAVTDRLLSAASTSSRADISLLQQARAASSPQAWDGVASAAVSRLGRNPQTGEFSPDRFLTAWGKISPQGKAVLFRSTGKSDLAKSLDDIAKVSGAFHNVTRYANTSRTAGSVQGGAMLTGAVAETMATGLPLTTLTTILSGRVTAYALSRPITARAIARWSRAYATGSAKAIALASKPLAFVLARELGRPDMAPRIEKELSGVQTGDKENEIQR